MVLAAHQREREGGNTTQSAVMGNKDALLGYAGLFPDVMAAVSERRVREGTGTPAQEEPRCSLDLGSLPECPLRIFMRQQIGTEKGMVYMFNRGCRQ